MQINLRNAMELKAAFWLDVLGMMINNIAFVIIWVFFFMKMGTVNGWGTVEAIGLNGFVGLLYGITYGLAGGATLLPTKVNSGDFDNYLISPVNLYVRILAGFSKTSAFGDMFYGIILLTVFGILAKISLFGMLILVLIVPVCALLMINFVFVSGLIAFLVPDTGSVANNLFELMITPSLYPSGLYSKTMKFIFLAIIPAIAIAGAPVELILRPTWGMFFLLMGLSSFWLLLALFLLKKAVRRYESGNLMGYKG